MEKFNTYDTNDSKTQRIDLHKNFRSRGEVLDSVNVIFQQIMTWELGGIEYDAQAALNVGANYPEAEGLDMNTEVLVVDGDARLEATAVAGRIRELIEILIWARDKITGTFRPVRYSDIVILIRSVQGFGDVFTEVLNQEGIPTYAVTKEGGFGDAGDWCNPGLFAGAG